MAAWFQDRKHGLPSVLYYSRNNNNINSRDSDGSGQEANPLIITVMIRGCHVPRQLVISGDFV